MLLEKNSHFTDDTVMTVAVADSIMNGVTYVESHSRNGEENIQGLVMVAGSGNGYIKMILSHTTASEMALQCVAQV